MILHDFTLNNIKQIFHNNYLHHNRHAAIIIIKKSSFYKSYHQYSQPDTLNLALIMEPLF